ncbi:acireductone synthase [Streptomyces meridianus]|uniref:Enolase-phosphatase E1 n=1 Tax=Streptomyces meridianus TaxID=2938945 RepID=A0ABT0XAP5_9ACTN|nr:acireductone synthase [Streptomyces meridianus]MCM2579601.1 acireductone synthase [Streptomyces meridianus]
MNGAVVLDIEGTTSAAAHVKNLLFPYARKRLADWVNDRGHEPRVKAALDEARELIREHSVRQSGDQAELVRVLEQWSDEDRKVTPLKTLQGMIWSEGYARGDLQGHIYPDSVQAIQTWRVSGTPLFIYSSGSVLAQQQWFTHTPYGDLTGHLAGYFDTETAGPKRETASYHAIAKCIDVQPQLILFVSDSRQELDAARRAQWRTGWVKRPQEDPSPESSDHATYPDLLSVARRETS